MFSESAFRLKLQAHSIAIGFNAVAIRLKNHIIHLILCRFCFHSAHRDKGLKFSVEAFSEPSVYRGQWLNLLPLDRAYIFVFTQKIKFLFFLPKLVCEIVSKIRNCLSD